jgi:CPA1 family monovalent cation:H+ antiporter
VRGLAKYDATTILIAVAITVGVVLLLRPVWLLLTQLMPRSLHTWLGGDAGADALPGPTRPAPGQRLG